MNIALLAHDNRKELLAQLCTAYCGILVKHTLCATARTANAVTEATGLPIIKFLSFAHGGGQQIAARVSYNELDMVISFNDPSKPMEPDMLEIIRLCDKNNIPYATNIATAELLILGMARGDLDWRDVANPKTKPFRA